MSEVNDMNDLNDAKGVVDHDEVAFLEPVRKPAGQSRAMRAGVVAGSALLVVIGATAAMGASPAPSANADPAASALPGANSLPGVKDGLGDKPAMRGDRGGFGRFRDITIRAITGSDVSLATDDGWSRTISIGGDVTLNKGGATITVGDLAVGDQVRFAQDRAADGAYTVTALAVVQPHLGGLVTAVDGDAISVTQRDGTTATIHVDGDTTYMVDRADGTKADVTVGSFVMAEGTLRDDGSLDAASVRTGSGDHGDRGPGFGRGHRGPGGPADLDDDSGSDSDASPAPSDSAS